MEELKRQMEVLARHVDQIGQHLVSVESQGSAITKQTKVSLALMIAGIVSAATLVMTYTSGQSTLREQMRVERESLRKDFVQTREAVLVLQRDVIHLREAVEDAKVIGGDRWTRSDMQRFVESLRAAAPNIPWPKV